MQNSLILKFPPVLSIGYASFFNFICITNFFLFISMTKFSHFMHYINNKPNWLIFLFRRNEKTTGIKTCNRISFFTQTSCILTYHCFSYMHVNLYVLLDSLPCVIFLIQWHGVLLSSYIQFHDE